MPNPNVVRTRVDSIGAGRTEKIPVATLALVFAVVFFGRAWLIHEWGSVLPYYDQWGAEGLSLYRPWLIGDFHWSTLFAAHNEHRIALTRIIDLMLFTASGRWLTWWQLLINAALHASCAAVLVRALWPAVSSALRVGFVAGVVLLFTSVPAWQNALWGFQSQFYLNHLFALLAFACVARAASSRARWIWGAVFAFAGLFSNGGGLPAAAVAFTLTVIAGLAERTPISRCALRAAAFGLVVMVGLLLMPVAAQHGTLHATSISRFAGMLAHCIGWPFVDSNIAWLAVQAPFFTLMGILVRRRRWPDEVERFLLAVCLFAFLLAAAMAFTRGGALQRPISRYQDTLMLGTAGNLGIVLLGAASTKLLRASSLVWCGLIAAGLINLSTTHLTVHLRYKAVQDRNGLTEVRSYLVDHDPAVFAIDPLMTSLSPDLQSVIRVLDDPVLRPSLPAEFTSQEDHQPLIIRFSPLLTAASALLLTLALFRRRPKSTHLHPDSDLKREQPALT